MSYSETQERLARALSDQARLIRLESSRRAWIGPDYTTYRASRREEARRVMVLRDAILAADPLELDAILDRR